LPGACDDAAALQPEPAADRDAAHERKRARLAAALLAFVAVAQFAGMLSHGIRPTTTHGLLAAFPHLAIVVPAGAFALGLWRGRRLRIATIAFAVLWSTLSVWTLVQLARYLATMTAVTAASVPSASRVRGFLVLVVARSICFTAATITLVTGRPQRTRRLAGAALGIVFALLFIAEHLFQHRRG
jgi:hypothetical protein